MKDSFGSAESNKRNIIWAILFVFIAAGSVIAVTAASKSFSLKRLGELLSSASPFYIVLAFAAMVGFVMFEGLAVRTLVRSFGHRCTLRDCFVYSAADIYFSAITPSATGGQPACAYFMIRSGVPASCTTVSLVFNLSLYTLSILVIALTTIVTAPRIFNSFVPLAKALIIIGALILVAIAALFFLALSQKKWINSIGEFAIRIACRLRLMKDPEAWKEKFRAGIEEYKSYASMIPSRGAAILKALGLNIMQRLCQFSVTMFMYIAIRINYPGAERAAVFKNGLSLLGAQSLITIGSGYIPIPGAMGVTDLMMLDGFRPLMAEADAASLELMSRSVSFYCCVLMCMTVVATALLIGKRRNRKTL